jgi:uracil-DNA glycosylase
MEKPETRSHRQERTVDTDANRTPARAADLLRRAPSPAAVAPSEETTRAAHEIARAAKTLVELRTALEQFEGCNLRLTATQLVFADGNPEARVMMVGEAPGRDEDLLPFIKRQIELVDPDFLLLLGKASAHTLLDSSEGILRLRGRWRDYDTGSRTIRAMATLHPAYLLRQPLQKRLAWRDFLALKATMDALPKPAS